MRTNAANNIGPLRGLRIDLTSGTAFYEELPDSIRLAVLGGRGLGVYLLLSEEAYRADPLSPDNPLIFAIGPLAGSAAPAAGRYSLVTRSPLTHTVFDGTSGGRFGIALRRLGLDYLVIRGSCSEPSYLVIDDRSIRLLPATHLWGQDVPTTLDRLLVNGRNRAAAVIGPAGERLVLFASVATERGRHVGRGGLGAVMGSKLLKGVVLDSPTAAGDSGPEPGACQVLQSVAAEIRELMAASPVIMRTLPEFGTSVLLNLLNEHGVLPTRNFTASQFELAEAISGESLRETYRTRKAPCEGCFVGCPRWIDLDGQQTRGPEYESLWALGADCGVADLRAIVRANDLCNRIGLDTISMGATLACAMELSERGFLRGGPRFGDADALQELVPATGMREGLGNFLAVGSRRLAEDLGRPDLAMHVKSLEMPAFDPRGMMGQGLAFATSNRGACHLRGNMLGPELLGVPRLLDRFAVEGKAEMLCWLQNLGAVLDSLPVCKFAAHVLTPDHLSRLVSAATGLTMSAEGLLQTGERIWNLERMFNLRAGFTSSEDTLPPRMLFEPIPAGPSAGRVVDLAPMLREYYVYRGWNEAGILTPEISARLGIDMHPDPSTFSRSAPIRIEAGGSEVRNGESRET